MLALLCVVVALTLAAACGALNYQVLTYGGQRYISVGEPLLDKKAKTYTFYNPRGEKVILVQDQVKSIKPSDQ